MEKTVISMREIQRNYKRILREAESKKGPVFLGSHGKPQAVLMDIEAFERLQNRKKQKNNLKEWRELRREFDELAHQGEQNVNLAQLIRRDRQSH